MEKILETADCMIQIIEDTIGEHKDWKKILPIPDNGDQHFLRVEKNLQTLRSEAISFKIYQNTRIRRINVCLSTVSSYLNHLFCGIAHLTNFYYHSSHLF